MKVTIEEAKQKWCPMVRMTDFPSAETVQDNRGETVKSGSNFCCIADSCMMFESAGTETNWVKGDYGQGTVLEEVEIFRCGLSR